MGLVLILWALGEQTNHSHKPKQPLIQQAPHHWIHHHQRHSLPDLLSSMINHQIGSQVRDPTLVRPKNKSHPFVLRFMTQMQLPRPFILPISFSRIVSFRVFDMDSWFNARILDRFFGYRFVGCLFGVVMVTLVEDFLDPLPTIAMGLYLDWHFGIWLL